MDEKPTVVRNFPFRHKNYLSYWSVKQPESQVVFTAYHSSWQKYVLLFTSQSKQMVFQQGNIIRAGGLNSVPSAHARSLCQLLGHKHQNLGQDIHRSTVQCLYWKGVGKKDKKHYCEMQKECHSRTVNMWPRRSHCVMGESAIQLNNSLCKENVRLWKLSTVLCMSLILFPSQSWNGALVSASVILSTPMMEVSKL